MAKITFASLKLKVKDDIKIVDLGDKVLEVKQYLPAEDKYDLIMITLQESKENNGIYNQFKMDMFFHLNLVFMYSNIQFTDKQKEDLIKLYDLLESNGIIAAVVAAIPEDEYNYLFDTMGDVAEAYSKYDNSFAGIVNNFMINMPLNAAEAAKIVDNFDPEKYGEVINFAKAIGMRE